MSFRVSGLSPLPFRHLFSLSDEDLMAHQARRVVCDGPGFPCRIRLVDAEAGEELILINFEHQPIASPYQSKHAIFVSEKATAAYQAVDEIPPAMASRTLSIRAFDGAGMIIDGRVCAGSEAATTFAAMLTDPATAYLHVHNAARGCYSGRVDRA